MYLWKFFLDYYSIYLLIDILYHGFFVTKNRYFVLILIVFHNNMLILLSIVVTSLESFLLRNKILYWKIFRAFYFSDLFQTDPLFWIVPFVSSINLVVLDSQNSELKKYSSNKWIQILRSFPSEWACGIVLSTLFNTDFKQNIFILVYHILAYYQTFFFISCLVKTVVVSINYCLCCVCAVKVNMYCTTCGWFVQNNK